jgi:hypothetical protein
MGLREIMHEIQEGILGLGIKSKPKEIVDDAWAKDLIPSQCVMYLAGTRTSPIASPTLLISLTLLISRAYK